MKPKLDTIIFALIEILIGSITLIAVLLSLAQGKSEKPLEILIFVLTAAIISAGLGLGILRRNLASYHLLLYLSSIIVFSKILIFTKIITLNGALETTIPSSLKNAIPIFYHRLFIFYFTRKGIKEQFGKRHSTVFSLKALFKTGATKHE